MDDKEEQHADIIERTAGKMGKWQWWTFFWLSSCNFPIAWHQMSIIFQAPSVNFTCADTNITDQCSPDCKEHSFDKSVFPNTIITQWDLVCEKQQLSNVIQTVTMLGILVGAILFGVLADRYGRRSPLVGAVVVQAISGTAASFVPWLWLHILLRFICAIATGGTMITSFVIMMEIVAIKWRTNLGIIYQVPFNLGHLTLPLIAYLIRDWRYNQLFLSATSFALVIYYWVIPESPRWLIMMGKTEKAIKILEKAAKINKRYVETIRHDVESHSLTVQIKKGTGGKVWLLLKTPKLRRRTISMFYNWLVFGTCFFGVAQYMGEMAEDKFVTVAVSAVVQIPGTLLTIVFLKKLGRKRTLLMCNSLTGVACLSIAVTPVHLQSFRIALGAVGMAALSCHLATIYVYAGEIFPTVLRNVACGTASVFARIGSMSAPYVAKPGGGPQWLGPFIFGVMAMLGACSTLVLPETRNCKLHDTIDDAENFHKYPKRRKEAKIEAEDTTNGTYSSSVQNPITIPLKMSKL